jgi:hypothetical protein
MAYRKKRLALDAVTTEPQEIANRDELLTEIFCTKFPPNTTIVLYLGQDKDPIDIDGVFSFQPTGEEAERGLFWTNPVAQPGVSVNVFVVTGSKVGRRNTLNPELRGT